MRALFLDGWIGFYAGRDLLRPRGWIVWLAIVPRKDLAVEGEEIPCGLLAAITTHPLRLRIRSQAEAIADRTLAAALSQGAR